MGKLLLIIFFSFPSLLVGQNSIGVLCNDFKINAEVKSIGKEFRKSFESILSNLDYPPTVIERENLSDLITKIEEERNLYNDFNNGQLEDLKAAKVDYVVYGNFHKSFINEKYEFQLEFVKISGENALSKRVFPILRFTEKELEGSELFEEKVKAMLNNYAFTKEFGIVENEQLDEIKRRLDEKDRQIEKLSILIENNIAKEDSIRNLKSSIPDVNFELSLIDSNLVIIVKFNNNVPIKMIPKLQALWDSTMKKYSVFNKAYLYPIEIFPPSGDKKEYHFIYDTLQGKKDKLPNDRNLAIRMNITYSSIYSAEIQKPELQNKLIKIDYIIELETMRFIPTKFKN